MSIKDVAINLIVNNKIGNTFSKLKTDLDNVKKSGGGLTGVLGALGNGFKGLAGAILANPIMAITTALLALIPLIKKTTEAYKESLVVQRQTAAVLASTGEAAGMTAEAVSELSNELMRETGISDESIQSAENMLLTFTNIGKDVFPEATKATLDMATAMNGGITPSSEQLIKTSVMLGKALNDPIAGMKVLTRSGVSLNEQQKENIKTLIEQGKRQEAQKLILSELSEKFGNSAKAQKDATKDLNNAMGELAEGIGGEFFSSMESGKGAIAGFIWLIKDWVINIIRLIKFSYGVEFAMAKWLFAINPIVIVITKIIPAIANFGNNLLKLAGIKIDFGAIFNFGNIEKKINSFLSQMSKLPVVGSLFKDIKIALNDAFDAKKIKIDTAPVQKNFDDLNLISNESRKKNNENAKKAQDEYLSNLKAKNDLELSKVADQGNARLQKEIEIDKRMLNDKKISADEKLKIEADYNNKKEELRKKEISDADKLKAENEDIAKKSSEESQKLAEEAQKDKDEQAARDKELKDKEIENWNKGYQATSDILGGTAALMKKGSAEQKALLIAQATMDTYAGATAAYKSLAAIPVVGPALGTAAAALAIAQGMANVQSITAIKMAEGGVVPEMAGVPSTGDNIPAQLNPNETVLNPKQNANLVYKLANEKTGARPGGSGTIIHNIYLYPSAKQFARTVVDLQTLRDRGQL